MKIDQDLASEMHFYVGAIFCIFWNGLLATSLSNVNVMSQPVDYVHNINFLIFSSTSAQILSSSFFLTEQVFVLNTIFIASFLGVSLSLLTLPLLISSSPFL